MQNIIYTIYIMMISAIIIYDDIPNNFFNIIFFYCYLIYLFLLAHNS
jgi:hypothetical protein